MQNCKRVLCRPILQSICHRLRVYYKEASENALAQCAKRDYRSGAQ